MSKTNIAITDADAAEFCELLKGICGGNPLMTPEASALMLTTIMRGIEKLQQQVSGAPGIRQEWGTCTDIARIYGKDRSTISRLLRPLAAEGKVRVCTTKDSVTGAYGGSMYNLADIERNFMENASEAAGKEGAA